jgi:hypothetical protein
MQNSLAPDRFLAPQDGLLLAAAAGRIFLLPHLLDGLLLAAAVSAAGQKFLRPLLLHGFLLTAAVSVAAGRIFPLPLPLLLHGGLVAAGNFHPFGTPQEGRTEEALWEFLHPLLTVAAIFAPHHLFLFPYRDVLQTQRQDLHRLLIEVLQTDMLCPEREFSILWVLGREGLHRLLIEVLQADMLCPEREFSMI